MPAAEAKHGHNDKWNICTVATKEPGVAQRRWRLWHAALASPIGPKHLPELFRMTSMRAQVCSEHLPAPGFKQGCTTTNSSQACGISAMARSTRHHSAAWLWPDETSRALLACEAAPGSFRPLEP